MPTHNLHRLAVPLIAMFMASCGGGLYSLPDPPAKADWTSVSLVPGQDAQDDAKRYVDARGAILKLYEALNKKDWDSAWPLLSTETQEMLRFGSADGDGLTPLKLGKIAFPNGSDVAFDPVGSFVVNNLRSLADEHAGSAEAETSNRKEIFATSADGTTRKVVVIFETGTWRVHRTKIDY